MENFENPTARPTVDVSVIIPVYNCEEFIGETLDSVYAQSLPEDRFEVIAVDDGSTDTSRQVLYAYAANHRNMTVLSIPNSGSASAPRNTGLDEARGRFVFFLDADDKLDESTLSATVAAADEHDSDVVLCKLGAFAEKRASPVPSRAFKKTQFAVDYIESLAYTTLGVLKLIRRSVIEGDSIRFPLGYSVGEDQPFMMRVYFNSRNVSILADKVYYWARGRGDGTNVTSAGQSPKKHYLKISALISAIATGTETGERRALLLERPVMGRAGIRTVFGPKFLDSFTEQQRSAMVQEFADLIEPMWNDELRSMGPLESQVLMDLILRRDVAGVETVSAILRNKSTIPLYFDRERKSFAYLPPAGDPVVDLKPRLEHRFSTIEPAAGGIRIRGWIGVTGADSAPESTRVVWKHRKSGEERIARTAVGQPRNISAATVVDFESTIEPLDLPLEAEWDLFVETHWADLVVRERAGNKKSPSIDTTTTLVGLPPRAALLFTRFGNASIDVGPVRKYPDAQQHIGYTCKGSFVLGRDLVIVIVGDIGPDDSITIVAEGTGPIEPKQVSKVDDECIAVVVPKSAQSLQAPRARIVHEGTEDFLELEFN